MMALMPVDEALKRIVKTARLMPIEKIKLSQGMGRILAADIKAKRDQPPFAASAMDGYALRCADCGAGTTKLKLIGVAAAGHGFKQALKQGQAVRILTGAPVPHGADTVVIQENTRVAGTVVEVLEAPILGKNIRAQGLDFLKADVLVPDKTKLGVRDIGLAAAGNGAIIRVRRKPRVVLFATGDELVLPGAIARADQIYSSNSVALGAMLEHWGAEVTNLGIVPDSMKATKAAIAKARNADMLVTTGGASVGDHDYVQEALKRSGIKIEFWKIALRPGKPLMFGTNGKLRVFGLPGNPVAALVCARLFIKPLLDAMLGVPYTDEIVQARLLSSLPANDGRQDYLRATLIVATDGQRSVQSFAKQDSSMQRNLRNADCLILRRPNALAAEVGDVVPVLILDF